MSFQRAVQTGRGVHALVNILSTKLPKLKALPPSTTSSTSDPSPDAERAALNAWLAQVSPVALCCTYS